LVGLVYPLRFVESNVDHIMLSLSSDKKKVRLIGRLIQNGRW